MLANLCCMIDCFLDNISTHPLISVIHIPDLAIVDFFLFSKLNTTVNGERFDDVVALQSNVTRSLKSFSELISPKFFRLLCTSVS